MAFLKYFMFAGCLITLGARAATNMDKKETISGVRVESGKNDKTRVYRGTFAKSFPYAIGTVKNSIVNFEEKCNNGFKNRRQYTDKKSNCKYHNDNLVETIVIKDIKQTGWTKTEGEIERFVLGRLIYNRGSFGFYEVVTVTEGKNTQNQKTITVIQKMLNDNQAAVYITPSFEKDSAFNDTSATYVLTEVSPNETALTYEYKAETDHWILNKEVSVPQVFASISKSINDLVKTMDKESSVQTRDVASN